MTGWQVLAVAAGALAAGLVAGLRFGVVLADRRAARRLQQAAARRTLDEAFAPYRYRRPGGEIDDVAVAINWGRPT